MHKSYITGIGTAVPTFQVTQNQSFSLMSQILDLDDLGKNRIKALYRATGISKRHTIIKDFTQKPDQFDWLPQSLEVEEFPSVAARMDLYKKEALPLSLNAVKALQKKLPNSELPSITHLITVSCTGMYAPGLDIDLVQQLRLSNNVQRTAINFMGCYGAFNGLKTADAICKSDPQAKVLLICTELCTLHFQPGNTEDETLSAALFADGSAAALIESSPIKNTFCLSIEKGYTDLFPEGDNDMAWHIGNYGFEMILSSYVPKLLNKGIQKFVDSMLVDTNLSKDQIEHWAIHPGGKQILKSIENALQLNKDVNERSMRILNEFGNMSSATILFVLEELMNDLTRGNENEKILSMAFGPGLTVEALLFKILFHC